METDGDTCPAVAGGHGCGELLAEFETWLTQQRGLSRVSVRCYVTQARLFLAAGSAAPDETVRELDAGQVTRFVTGYCQDRNRWSAKAMVTALRAFLRFAHATGRTAVPLAAAVPAVASWRMAALPRGLSTGEVERLLAGCDQTSPVGRRDYAVLCLLARLGLRGAEVAGLQLDDIDWRAGEITVRGKGERVERLPLPASAGHALAIWLSEGRPRCDSRAVFVTVRQPIRQLTPEALRQIMRHACTRAGLERCGAHQLRHTLATEMLRAGASLTEVGQVLRHRSQLSTSIYAKVDQNALRPLARPWPGAVR